MSDSEDQSGGSSPRGSAAAASPAAKGVVQAKANRPKTKLQLEKELARLAKELARIQAAAAAAPAAAAAAVAAAAAASAAGANDAENEADNARSDSGAEEVAAELASEAEQAKERAESVASAAVAAAQLAPLAAARSAHLGPRPPPVAPWAGVASDFERWLAAMARSNMHYGTPQNERVRAAAVHLTDAAWDWFASACARAEADGSADPLTWTWALFTQHIKERFIPVTSEETAREKLHGLVQGKSSASEYVDAFRRLVNRISDMGAADQLAQFMRGLRANIATQLRIQQVKSVDQAFMLAVLIGSHHEQSAAAAGHQPAHVAAMDASADEAATGGGSWYGLNAVQQQQALALYRDHGRRGQAGPASSSGPAAGGSSSFRRGPRPLPKIPGCTEAQVKGMMETGACFTCGKEGHYSKECALPRRKN